MTKKYGYYLNLENGEIVREETEKYTGANWGDYHWHDMFGPYKTVDKCFEEAYARYNFDIRTAKTKLQNARRTAIKLKKEREKKK